MDEDWIAERSLDDAPVEYDAAEAFAWVAGYEAAVTAYRTARDAA